MAIRSKIISADYVEEVIYDNGLLQHTRTYTWETKESRNPIWYSEEFKTRLTEIVYYKSGWGNEWRETSEKIGEINQSFEISEQTGRSSGTYMPFFLLKDDRGGVFSYALAYSGNWKISIAPSESGRPLLTIGFDDAFYTEAKEFTCPSVMACPEEKSDDERQRCWQRFSNNKLMLKALLHDRRPVIWNHWWAYEDRDITEDIFLANAKVAKEIGVELCVLDAGWFGPTNSANWYDVRGDWGIENTRKFPHGIAYLAEQVHQLGLKFGLWIEIEAVGQKAHLVNEKPSFIAQRDGESLGYLCFGNKEVVDWALETVSALVEKTKCEWIKFDFNLNPEAGCNCVEHGHGKGDGLYEHYQGLYRFLHLLHIRYPKIIFESCSSGGLRTDYGLLSHVHVTFLSDVDTPEHQIRCLSHASKFIHPKRILHFVPSQTLANKNGQTPFPSTNFSDFSDNAIRRMMQLGASTTMGISHRLIDYDDRVLHVMKEEIEFYKEGRKRGKLIGR